MDRGELEAAVARAIADTADPGADYLEGDWLPEARAAVRVVLAEAQRSIVPLVADCICDKAATCDECFDMARGWVAEALAALGKQVDASYGVCGCGHEMDEHGCPLGH